MPLLEVKGVTKYYGKKKVLDNVSFSLEKGEILSLLGPNGAGKTTLMRIIAEGLTHQGHVFFKGKILKDRSVIGYCPQEGILYEDLTAYANLKFYSYLHKRDGRWARKMMEKFEIPNKKVKELSGGMKKRLSIVIALVGDPELLILDEPTVGLDVESRHQVWKIIRSLREEGKGIILSTHYMGEAEHLADRVAIINEGKIITMDTVDALKRSAGIKSAIEIRGLFQEIPEGFVRENSSLVFYSQEPKRDLVNAVTIASKVGKIKEVVVREPTLEDIFIKLTGRRLKE